MISKLGEQQSLEWLALACNELRVFGEFTMVTKRIAEFPNNTEEMVKYVIKRLNSDFEDEVINQVYKQSVNLIINDDDVLSQLMSSLIK